MAEAQTFPDYPKGLDFQQVWAALMEDREQLKETKRILRENAERFDRQMEESRREREESREQQKEAAERFDRQMEEARREREESRRKWEESNEESNRKWEESNEESRRKWEESIEESNRKWEKSNEEFNRKWEETNREWNKRFGDFSRRFGEIAEYMVAPNLREKFREFGYDFPKANPNSDVTDRINNIHLEIDILLENGVKAMLVEVKSKPSTEDVQAHIERLEKMRKYADLRGDKRTFLGAVAGVVMTENVRDYVLKQGFFAIEPSGETFNIIPPNNKPKEW
jgi:DNA repair exonuclease SbcCD ATPase subunit